MASFTESGEYDCGAHPDSDTIRHVVPITHPNSQGSKISELLGSGAGEMYFRAMHKTAKDQHQCDPDEVDAGDGSNWGIVRRRGHWAVEGHVQMNRLCNDGFDFEVPVALPESITGPDRLPIAWEVLSRAIAGLSDAFASPNGDFLIALTASELLVYLPSQNQLGKPILQLNRDKLGIDVNWYGIPELQTDGIVMIQWALGPAARRWLVRHSATTGRIVSRIRSRLSELR